MSVKSLPRLEIYLLGAPQVRRGESDGARGMPVKAQALLYYLAATGQTHTRAALAHLLWSEHGEAEARSNLRKGIQELRERFGAYLAIDYHSVGLVSTQLYWVDAAELSAGASEPCATDPDRFEAALALYRADFLDGFHVRDAPEFEAWLLHERARLRELMTQGLSELAAYREARGDMAQAITIMRRLLELEPWREEAHRQLMTWLAQSGQRNAALLQYEVCRRVLADELGVEPEKATRELHVQLLQTDTAVPSAAPQVTDAEYALVGRRQEWQALQRAWAKITQSGAQMVLIAGEAGIGKTRLAEELLVHVQRQGDVTARARAYALEGRLAYAPLAEWLRSTSLQRRLARLDRIWLRDVSRLVPELLIQYPDLPAPEPLTERWQQKQLFEALRHVFTAEARPLLLLLDDLQWCDAETLAWLQFLIESAPEASVLVVGTVRIDELGGEHPVHKLRYALQCSGRLATFDLAPLSQQETAALGVEVRQHAVGKAAAAALYQATGGNPLFVVETARFADNDAWLNPDPYLCDRRIGLHDLSAVLPPKVQAVIEYRLAQMSENARMITEMAATIGREFTTPLLMAACRVDEETILSGLNELWQRRIVRNRGGSKYDFTHDRIRDVAYSTVGPVKKAHYHRRVAQALAMLHDSDPDPFAGELAIHYEHAGAWEESFAYFRRAATVAKQLYAHAEAVNFLQKAIAVRHMLPSDGATTALEIELWYDLGLAQGRLHDWGSQLVAAAWLKADELAAKTNNVPSRCRTLNMLAVLYGLRGDWEQARAVDELALSLARQSGDVQLLARQSAEHGTTLYHFGALPQALTAFKQDPVFSATPVQLAQVWLTGGIDSSMLLLMAQTLWMLGFSDQAVARVRAVLDARDQQTEFSVRCAGLVFAGMLYALLSDVPMVQQLGEELAAFCTQYDYPWYVIKGRMYQGWALAQQGNVREGLPLVRMGVDDERRRDIRDLEPFNRALLAETLALAGEWEEALYETIEARAYAEECGNCFLNSHLLKLQGDFLQALSFSADEVEACYQQAIVTARQQGAKSLELRATTSLARLWQAQGKQGEAREIVLEIYNCFTEGFETADLLEAKALLEKL